MGHWYTSDGSPMYEVPKLKGEGTRPTTLADARKLNLVPSVTTILSLVAKPGLEKWKTDQLLKAVLANPYQYGWDDDSELWKRMVYAISQAETKKAADKGNQVHNVLEMYYTTGLMTPCSMELMKFCTPVVELIDDTFGPMCEWVPEASFSHSDGFGGKCDLHLKPCKTYPNGVILDFKTKSAENFSKVKAYDEHCMQLVAYRQGFNINKADCYNLFIGTNKPGDLMLHKWEEKYCKKACKMFNSLLCYWKESNNFKG